MKGLENIQKTNSKQKFSQNSTTLTTEEISLLFTKAVQFQQSGQLKEAEALYKNILSFNQDIAEVHCNLGSVQEILEDSLKSYERALSIKPDYADAHINKGNILTDLGRLDEAIISYKIALEIHPQYAEAKCNLGVALLSMRRLDEALNCFKDALADKPDYRLAANNYLHTFLYLQDVSNDELFNVCQKIAKNSKPKINLNSLAIACPKQKDRIRIGYISSDFQKHPVGYNILPILSNHDRQRYEIFCYAELSKADCLTSEFQELADHWRVINNRTDSEVAETMRSDGIHIAVFLGGHFDENRPEIANYNAAPVNVAMHGGTTTALDSMDYWLSDGVLHPKEEKDKSERFTETIWRLPNFYNFTIPNDAPDVSPLPASKNGYVTFVSFNKPCKINDDVLDLWSGVLHAVPKSKLILKFRNHLANADLADPIRTRFRTNGITDDRIELINSLDDFNEHLANYHRGDIALDTFPFSGATTTFQALWMGLPVVSLYGNRFISRMGASISQHLGLIEHLTTTPENYINICTKLAQDLDHLRNLRLNLRNRISNSQLCNGPTYAQNFENALQAMWKNRNKAKD